MSDVVKVEDILKALVRHIWIIVLLAALGVSGTIVALKTVPKKFKSRAVISIQSSYFENPLVHDLIPEISDPGELNARRAALLRLSLNEAFIDQLGEAVGYFKSTPTDKVRIREREILLEQIAYFSLSPSTYQVSVTWNNADTSQTMTRSVVEQMINTLIRERFAVLENTRNTIKTHVESLGLKLRDLSSPAATLDPESLRSQLEKVNKDLMALLVNYTEKHPEVVKLKAQALSLENLLANSPVEQATNKEDPLGGYLPAAAKQPIEEVYNELLKKLNYLNLILDVERDKNKISHVGVIEQPVLPSQAFFPNPKVFLSIGMAIALTLALLIIVFIEMRKGTFISTEQLETKLDVPFLGELPKLANSKKILLLPSGGAVRRALPWAKAKEA